MSNLTDNKDTDTLSILASNHLPSTTSNQSSSLSTMSGFDRENPHALARGPSTYRSAYDMPERGKPNPPFKPSSKEITRNYIREVAIVIPKSSEAQGTDPRVLAYQIIRKSFPLININAVPELKNLMGLQIHKYSYDAFVEEYLHALHIFYSTDASLLDAFYDTLPDEDLL